MKFRYVILSFLVMGWGYYALSGGADFVPERRIAAVNDTPLDQSPHSPPDASPVRQPVSLAGVAGAAQGDVATETATGADISTDLPVVTRIKLPASASSGGTPSAEASGTMRDTLAGAPADEVAQDVPVFTSLSGTGAPSDADARVADRPVADRPVADSPIADRLAADPTNVQAGEETLAQAVVSPRRDIDLRRVAGSAVNMRDGPGMGYVVIETLPADTEAEVIETENGWVYVRLMNGTTGWVAARLLTGSGI